MNIKWVTIGVIFLILIVVFYRNPVEEDRARKEAAMEGKDRLVESIKEYNSKPSHLGGSFLSGKKTAPEPVVSPARPATTYPVQPSAQTVPVAPIGQPQTPPEPEGYYPPPPLNQ